MQMTIMTKEEKEKKALEALERLAFGGKEVKIVRQMKNNGNGRHTEVNRTVTEVDKLPDRSALFKWLEINDVYVDASVQIKRDKVAELQADASDDELLDNLDMG